MDKNKFVYHEEGELEIADCQCEFCLLYQGGQHSSDCPVELLDAITRNEVLCPNMKTGSILDSME